MYNVVSGLGRNSSQTALAGGAVFTGVWEDVKDYAEVVVSVATDQASATNGLVLQGSSNQTDIDSSDAYTCTGVGTFSKTFKVGPGWQWVRLVYTNGATPNTVFRLQTIFKLSRTRPSSVKMADNRSVENDFEESASYQGVFNGTAWDLQRTPFVFKTLNAVSIAAEATIWTPAAGKKFRLMGYLLTSGVVGGNVILKDNTAGATIHIVPFGAAAVPIGSPPYGNGQLSATANNVLTATGVATQTLSGTIWGTEE